MKRALALALALQLAGCSFVLVRPVTTAEPEPTTWPRCTEHNFWAIADGAMAAIALTGVIYFLRSDDELAPVGWIINGGMAAGFGISALTGLNKTSRCRQAREAYEKAAAEGR